MKFFRYSVGSTSDYNVTHRRKIIFSLYFTQNFVEFSMRSKNFNCSEIFGMVIVCDRYTTCYFSISKHILAICFKVFDAEVRIIQHFFIPYFRCRTCIVQKSSRMYHLDCIAYLISTIQNL